MADTAAKTTDFVSSLLDGTLQDQLAKAFAAIQHGAELIRDPDIGVRSRVPI